MALNNRYRAGDEVVHPSRPEWGTGIIRRTDTIVSADGGAQRLTVDFPNRGRVIINTAIATLIPKEGTASMSTHTSGGWLGTLEQASKNSPTHELWDLPDAMTDPFTSMAQRLSATLDSFRFSTAPRSLIEWACAQTGLQDPLSKYTRQQLEQHFSRFARDRDLHLKQLVQQLKRNGEQQALRQARRTIRYPEAQSVLDKALTA